MTKQNHNRRTPQAGAKILLSTRARTLMACMCAAMCLNITASCQSNEQSSSDGCQEALDGASSLVVQNASGTNPAREADLEVHRRNVARAIAPSFLERCQELSQAKRNAFSDCVTSADGLSDLKKCEAVSFSNGKASKADSAKEETDES